VTARIALFARQLAPTALLLAPWAITTASAQAPSAPPAPMALKPATLPPFQNATLPNGLRLVLVENHRNPSVVFRLAVPAGTQFDPAGKAGTASMVAGLLTKGAGARTAEQLAAAIENTGGSLVAAADDDFLSVYGSVLSNATPLAFELLGDAVARPSFLEKEFELARMQTLSGLQLNSASPAFLAAKTFRAGLYGAHPYGVTATPATVRAITRADVQQFHAARVRPRGALLIVAGDITMPQLTALASKAFSGWTGVADASPTRPAPPPRTATEIVLVHRPGSVQSNVLIGNLALGPAEPLRLAAELATQVLGGGSDGRLFKTLREQKGWTYGAYASLTRPRGVGRFEANAEVRTDVTDSAVVEMLAQLTRLRTETIPAKELDDTRGGMIGSFPLAIETPNGLAAIVAFMKLYGLPADYLQTYRTRLAVLTASQVRAAAARAVRPSQALIVVVGDGATLYDRLARIAPVTLRSADGDVLQPSDLAPKGTASSALPSGAPRPTPPATGNALLAQMRQRYEGKWFTTLRFTQKTTTRAADGTESISTWYESVRSTPTLTQLRIDVGDPAKGNGVLYTADSLWQFRAGKQVAARSGGNTILPLIQSVYVQPVARTMSDLKATGVDLSRATVVRQWEGKPVWVVGAASATDTISPQFWVEPERLVVVRAIFSPVAGAPVMDMRFERIVPLAGGWLATRCTFFVNGALQQAEDYEDWRANIELSPALFSGETWSTAPHWANGKQPFGP
jgi:zinc protease